MEISDSIIKLDEPTTEINVWIRHGRVAMGAKIVKAKQDKLGRVYITIQG